MTTKWYLRNLTPAAAPTANTKQSATMPVAGHAVTSDTIVEKVLSATRGGTATSVSVVANYATTTGNYDAWVGRWSSGGLAAGTYGSGNWSFAVQSRQSNAGVNAFHAQACCYFWRPSNSSVVGYVFDSSSTIGVEVGNNGTGRYGQVLTIAGSDVTIQDGDVLVLEVWMVGNKTDTMTRTTTVWYDANVDVTAAYTGTAPASYLSAPADLPEYVVASPTVASGTGTGQDAKASIGASAGAATATGTAHDASVKVAPQAEVATATGTAYDATAVSGVGIIHDASTNGGSITSGTTRTFAHTIGGHANRLLVVSVGIENTSSPAPAVSTVTYNGVALTYATAISTTEVAVERAELWYALEADLPAAGTYNVVVTLASGVTGQMIVAATSVYDAAQVAPAVNQSQSGADGLTYSTSITTLAGYSWVFDAIAGNTNTTWTADGGQLERSDQQAGGNLSSLATSTKSLSAAGSTTLGWTAASSQGRFAHVMAAWPAAISWTTPTAQVASATGTAHAPGPSVAVNAGSPAATGQAYGSTTMVAPTAEPALAIGTAWTTWMVPESSGWQVWTGLGWTSCPVKVWTGGEWRSATVKVHSGGSWS